MPINQSIWKINDSKETNPIHEIQLEKEEELEDILHQNISILNDNYLLIGRQVSTSYNKYIDLLAIDGNGSIVIIELKKNKTPREVVAQTIDYASWVKDLESEDIASIYERYASKYNEVQGSLDEAFLEKFGFKLEEEDVNSSHQMVIVAASLDYSTERIISYLSDSEIPINIVFFKVFESDGSRLLSRAWVKEPEETSIIASSKKSKEPWNGEYYVSFGDTGKGRRWEDAKRYGFISGGGGLWYSRTLNLLNEGDRVWVNIPHEGYVGVGIVTSTADIAKNVQFDGKTIFELDTEGNYTKGDPDDEDKAEFIVKVDWIKAEDKKDAVSEVGFFGNQNTVCKPTTPKWNFTVERLKSVWDIQ